MILHFYLKNKIILISILLGLIFFLFYIKTLAPGVYVHDSGDMCVAASTLSISHPSGSPFHALAGKLATILLPFGEPAYRINLLSALAAALAVVLCFQLVQKLTKDNSAALLAAMLLGFSEIFWSQAVMAEVYTLNDCFLLSALILFEFGSQAQHLYALAFLAGLLLSNHLKLIFVFPLAALLLLYKYYQQPKLTRLIVICLCFFILGLSTYLYLPLRASTHLLCNWGDPQTFENLKNHIFSKKSQYKMFFLSTSGYIQRTSEMLQIWFRQFGPNWLSGTVLFLALIGLIRLLTSKRRLLGLLLAGVIGGDLIFNIFFDAAPLESEAYGEPIYVSTALLAGFGFYYIFTRLAIISRSRQKFYLKNRIIIFLKLLLCFSMPLLLLLDNYYLSDRHKNYLVENYLKHLMRTCLIQSTLFLEEDNHVLPMAYLYWVKHYRPDIRFFDRNGNHFEAVYGLLYKYEGIKRAEQQNEVERKIINASEKPVYYALERNMAGFDAILKPQGLLYKIVKSVQVEKFTEDINKFYLIPEISNETTYKDYMDRAILGMYYYILGDSERFLGKKAEAMNLYLKAQKWGNELATMHLNLGKAYEALNEIDLAKKAYQLAITKDNRLNLAKIALAKLFLYEKNFEKSEALLNQALAEPYPEAQAYFYRGLQRQEEDRSQEAVEDYKEALELDSSLYQAWQNLGNIYRQLDMLEQAKLAYAKAIKINRFYAPAYVGLAELDLALGQLPSALLKLQAAVKLQPDLLPAQVNLAFLYERTQQPTEVCAQQWQVVYELLVKEILPADDALLVQVKEALSHYEKLLKHAH